MVELVVPRTVPDSDEDDEPVAQEVTPMEAVEALQLAVDSTAADWRNVCRIADKRVQIGAVLREHSAVKPLPKPAETEDIVRAGQIQLPPLLAAVVDGSVRWCKVCKLAFAGAQCANIHAIFHYTKLIPLDVLAVLEMEARLTALRLKWAALDPATQEERAAAMLQAVVRGKIARRRAFQEDQWRRLGLRIDGHVNKERLRRDSIGGGRRDPTRRRWQLRWAVRTELRWADSQGLTVAVPSAQPRLRSRHPLLPAQVIQVDLPGPLRSLYTFTRYVEPSTDLLRYYRGRDTLDPEELQLADHYSGGVMRLSAGFVRRRGRVLHAAVGVRPPAMYRRLPAGVPAGSEFRVAASLLMQTMPESALGALVRTRQQLAVELRRLQLLRLGIDRRRRIKMTEGLIRSAGKRMLIVAAVAVQSVWRGSCRRAAVRGLCGPILARDAVAVGLSLGAHRRWKKGGGEIIPPMKLVLQVLAARVQQSQIQSLRDDVLAHRPTEPTPPEADDSPGVARAADGSALPFVTVRYWKESLALLDSGTAKDDVVRLVMDVGSSRRVFTARRALLLAGLPKFREDVIVRGSMELRRRVKLEPDRDTQETIEKLIGYVHGERVRLDQANSVALITAARHYGARGEAYERMIRAFDEVRIKAYFPPSSSRNST